MRSTIRRGAPGRCASFAATLLEIARNGNLEPAERRLSATRQARRAARTRPATDTALLGCWMVSVETTRPSLDDVFLTYTGRTIRDAEATAGDRNRASPFVQGRR